MVEKLKKKEDEKRIGIKEKGLFIAGGLIAIAAVSVSYAISVKHTLTKMELGFAMCCGHDPTLGTHFRKVLDELDSKLKKK